MKCSLTSLVGLLLGQAAGLVHAASIAGVGVPPPPAPGNVVDTYYGVSVDDPFRYFEEVKDPEVQRWLRAQADATTAILARIPGRAPLLARMAEIEAAAPGLADRVVRTRSERYFFLRRNPGEDQFKLVWRDGINGTDTVLIDPEALSRAAGRPHAIMDFAPSDDGRKIAYSIQVGGGEIGTLHVIDVASGRDLIEPIDRIRYASASWLADGSGFFYTRLREGYDKLPPTERFQDTARHFRGLDQTVDRRVFSASLNPELKLPTYAVGDVFQVPGTQLAAAVVYLGVERNRLLYLAELDAAKRGTAQWRPVVELKDKVSDVAFGGGWIYLRSALDAPRYQVLRVPLGAPELKRAEVVVPASRSVITRIAGARDGLYITRRDGATLSLSRLSHGREPKLERIALPFEGNVQIEATDPELDGAVLDLAGWTRAAKPYLYDPVKGAAIALPFVANGTFDSPGDIMAREVMVRSHDGIEVPVSILSRKDIKLDGRNPTIVYGYGAYGITEDPFFSPRIYAWLERGGVYAMAHVRGGGAFGEEWHLAGRKTTKPNTWKDGIAVAEWLVANGYSTRDRIGIYGGSAGGIFVGRAITERPDLFAAAVSAVGVHDLVRSETRANGVANVPEYGTVKKEDEFRALLAMSSYHHVKDGQKYPAVMLVHGVNDTRVDVWQSAKFAARLAAATAQSRPVLMRLEYESGHGQGSTRVQARERTGDVFSFFLWQFGVPDFQPTAKP